MKYFLFFLLMVFGISSNLFADSTDKITLKKQKPIPTMNKPKFNVNFDLSGFYDQSYNITNYNNNEYFKCTSSIFAMYRLGKFEIGTGGRFGVENSIKKQSGIRKVVNSIVLGLNYIYGKNDLIQYQLVGRTFYNFYGHDRFTGRLRSEGFSALLGWGPKVNFSHFQISPVFNLDIVSRNTNMRINADYFIKSGFLLNLSIPIK